MRGPNGRSLRIHVIMGCLVQKINDTIYNLITTVPCWTSIGIGIVDTTTPIRTSLVLLSNLSFLSFHARGTPRPSLISLIYRCKVSRWVCALAAGHCGSLRHDTDSFWLLVILEQAFWDSQTLLVEK